MTRRSRNLVALLATAALATSMSAAPTQAATSHPATVWPASQFGTAATENITKLLGSPGSSTYTVLGTTTGAFTGKTSAGGVDAFIRRTTTSTVALRQYGTAGDDVPYDEYGTTEVGSTTGAVPGHTSAGGTDGYVWSFKGGKTAWATRLGTAGEDKVVAIAKGHKYLYAVGTTTGTFGGETNLGGTDYFIARISPVDGEIVSVEQLGTAGDDRVVSVSVTTEFVGLCCGYEDDVTVSGDTTGTFPDQTSKGGRDLFAMNTGSSEGGGAFDQFGTSGDDVAIAADGKAIAGSTTGAFPGSTNKGGTDAFVARPGWDYQFGSAGDDKATGLTRSNTAYEYPYTYGYLVTGETTGALPGLSSNGGSDVFALRVDGDALRWRTQKGSTADDHGGSIISTRRGAIWGGQTFGGMDGGTSNGGGDVFLDRVTWTRPDAAIDYVSSGARPTGANLFGEPTIPFYIGSKARKAWIHADDDGDGVDSRRVVGCGSTSVFTVRYYNGRTGSDVTSSVLAGTFQVTSQTTSGHGDVTAVITPRHGVAAGTAALCKVRVYSVNRPTIYDDVTLRVVR